MTSQQKLVAIPLPIQLAIAGIANACGGFTTHPIDVIKVRLQLQGLQLLYTGWLSGLGAIYAAEGMQGLFRGLAPSLLRECSYSAMRLGLYGPVKGIIWRSPELAEPLWAKIAAGGVSGCIGCAIASPTDLIKIRMQAVTTTRLSSTTGVSQQSRATIFGTVRHVYVHEGGLRGLWQGVEPNVQRAALLTAAQVGTYDAVKPHLRETWLGRGAQVESPLLHVASAFIAGLVTALVTTPVDTAKSRIMNQKAERCGTQLYRGTFDCLSRMVREEGLLSLYAGFWPTWVRVGMHSVVTFSVYEQLRRLVGMRPV